MSTGRAGSTRRSTTRSPGRCSTRTSRCTPRLPGEHRVPRSGRGAVPDRRRQNLDPYLNHPALRRLQVEVDGASLVYAADHEPSAPRTTRAVRGLDREEADHIGFVRGADLLVHDSQYLEEEYPESGMGPQHGGVRGRRAVAAEGPVSRCSITTRRAPTRRRRPGRARPARATASASPARCSPLQRAPPSRCAPTTMRVHPDHRHRDVGARARRRQPVVAIAVTDRNIEAELLEAAAAEGFEALTFASLDASRACPRTRHADRRARGRGGRSLDDLAADAHAVVAATPEGATVAYVTKDAPWPTRSGRRSPTGWCGPHRSRTCARSCGRGRCGGLVGGARVAPGQRSGAAGRAVNLGILDTEPEDRFDRYTEVACDTFDVPIALVSLVDSDRQWFKSHHGIDITETHRDLSMRAGAISRTTCSWSPTRCVTTASPTTRTSLVGHASFLRRRAADRRRAVRRHALHHGPPPTRAERTAAGAVRELGRMVEAELVAAGDESPTGSRPGGARGAQGSAARGGIPAGASR